MRVSGQIFDSATGQPIPAATVELVTDELYPYRVGGIADNNGKFSFEATGEALQASYLMATSVGFHSILVPTERLTPGIRITLQKNFKEMEEVVIKTGSKKSLLFLLLFGLLIISQQK